MEKIKEKIYNTFRALYSRNYRLFFLGQCISLIGTWIQNIAMMWLVYKLTNSALAMGMVMFINSLPAVIMSPLAGVIVDRVNKYRALIIVQILFGLFALTFALLTLSGLIKIWHIVFLGIFVSVNMAFDMPLRQALVINLVDDKKDLNNAISLNSSSFNLARLIGPSVAGVIIAVFNEGICFLINALSYIAVIWALLIMKITKEECVKINNENIVNDFKEGLSYAINSKPIKNVLIFLSLASFIGMSYPLLIPILAKDILHGDARTLGMLMSSAGVGALIASLRMASKTSISGLPKWLCIGALLLSFGMIGLGFNHHLYIALILMFFVGFGMVSVMITSNTLLQHTVENSKRGRIMSLYSIAFTGTLPFSNLASGAIAHRVGILNTFIVFGLSMITVVFLFYKRLKSIKF